jgi:hypothetical protein
MLSAAELAAFRRAPTAAEAPPSVFGPPARLSDVFLQRLFEEVLARARARGMVGEWAVSQMTLSCSKSFPDAPLRL